MSGDLGGFLLQLQRGHGNRYVQRLVEGRRPAPGAGLPDGIKSAIERRSGVDLSGARVHYDSPWPARLGALACTQGEEIHVAPGQEKHLAHEAWHVVQQRQGRVRATRTENGIALNDDAGLEREAGRAGHASPAPVRPHADIPQSRGPAPVQLHREHVNARLLEYWKKTLIIGDVDRERVFAIFTKWVEYTKEADKLNGRFPAGTHRWNAMVMITKDVIETLNATTEISAPVRRTLVRLWNKDTPPDQQVAFTEPALDPSQVMAPESGVLTSWAPMSPYSASYSYDPMETAEPLPSLESLPEKESKKERKKERKKVRKKSKRSSESESGSEGEGRKKPARKKKRKDAPEPVTGEEPKKERRKSKTLRSGAGKRATDEDVPVVDTVQESALIIRSFTKREDPIPPGLKFMWGPGMFEKGPYEDIVYTLLTETETGGVFSRSGGVDSWDAILAQVPQRLWNNPARFFHDLQKVLREKRTDDPVLALVAGAMISDVKHGIDEWIQVLSELYPMLRRFKSADDVRKLFKAWYVYTPRGGRDQRGRTHRSSYRDEPGRVKTKEWEYPTLIPSRGGFDFPGARAPFMPDVTFWEKVQEYLEPKDIWALAMASKFFYNLTAKGFRTSQGIELT